MLFLHLVEAGRFGRVEWGAFDPMRVTEMLHDFLPVRAHYIEKEEQRKEAEYRAHHEP